MAKSRTIRPPSNWTVLWCILVTMAANLTIAFSGNSIDVRRTDQILIGELRAKSFQIVSILDGGMHGEDISKLPVTSTSIGNLLGSLYDADDPEDVTSLKLNFVRLLDHAREEYAALRDGDQSRAIMLDSTKVDPAFDAVDSGLASLEAKRRAEAATWTTWTHYLTTACLLVAGLLVGTLFTRHKRRLIALQTMKSDRLVAESSERRFRSLVRNTADVIAVVNAEGVFSLVSEVTESAWGHKADSLLGESLYSIVHGDDVLPLKLALEEAAAGKLEGHLEVRMLEGTGNYRPTEVFLADLTSDPDVGGFLLTFHDLSERKEFEAELLHHAFHDRLTGLPNRALFLDRLTHRIQSSAINDSSFAVLFIDLDNFKVINDSLGHDAGDQLLIMVTERLQGVIRPADSFSRLGGDEFTLLLEDARTQDDAIAVAERMFKALQKAITIAGREVFVTASIGITMSLESTGNALSILRDADTAMYHAKGRGKSGYAVFETSMNEYAVERMELESELRLAMGSDELVLYYQPIVNIETGEVVEVEALLRWDHPTRGQLLPLKFIPIAEETGLISQIGLWVIRTACNQLRDWDRSGSNSGALIVSVNVSGKQLEQPSFVADVQLILAETRIAPNRIELEITETAMLKDLDRMAVIFQQLRSLGVRIAIDDFGTGYSSIAYLSRLPVDTLKIDRSFISPLGGDERTSSVVQAMISMAKGLGLKVTSEGIESPDQLQTLRDLGCGFGQGFLFAKPELPTHHGQFDAAVRTTSRTYL